MSKHTCAREYTHTHPHPHTELIEVNKPLILDFFLPLPSLSSLFPSFLPPFLSSKQHLEAIKLRSWHPVPSLHGK